MKTTERLLNQLMVTVGLRLEAFEDAAGVPTIGYGHTKGVRMGDRISEYWAKDLLRRDIDYFERKVLEMQVARTEGQLDALVSLAFGIGLGALRRSLLVKVIREGGSRSQIRKELRRSGNAEWEAKRFFE